jgi:hypothetical protein
MNAERHRVRGFGRLEDGLHGDDDGLHGDDPAGRAARGLLRGEPGDQRMLLTLVSLDRLERITAKLSPTAPSGSTASASPTAPPDPTTPSGLTG